MPLQSLWRLLSPTVLKSGLITKKSFYWNSVEISTSLHLHSLFLRICRTSYGSWCHRISGGVGNDFFQSSQNPGLFLGPHSYPPGTVDSPLTWNLANEPSNNSLQACKSLSTHKFLKKKFSSIPYMVHLQLTATFTGVECCLLFPYSHLASASFPGASLYNLHTVHKHLAGKLFIW